MEVEEEHHERTALTIKITMQNDVWIVQNSPATFPRLMESVLSGLNLKICLIYLDDIVVFGKSVVELTDHLGIWTCGLKLRPDKCEFFHQELKYLGHIITSNGVECDPVMF